jgi:hypothetical protein
MISIQPLRQATGLDIYDASLTPVGEATWFLARRNDRNDEKVIGIVGAGCETLSGCEELARIDGQCVCVGPADHANAEAVRRALPWTQPTCLGLATSVGLGDRLGLATPGHVRAVRGTGLRPILAQQSIREMARTHRTPEQVMDAATWGALQEGWRDGFGSDADHLQKPEDIDVTVAAGFTMFTIDPGLHVVNEADELDPAALGERFEQLDFETLETSADEFRARYASRRFDLHGGPTIEMDDEAFLRAAVKYGGAIAHTVKMFRHLLAKAESVFELEVSVDETESPTSVAEHYLFASELKRLGVEWVSLAPRFIGRFEKGVDYIGDVDAFRASFADHVAVMRTLGPYKMSIHSGSDKFSIYPIVAELTGGMVHLKTAGTSYLEALRAVAAIEPDLLREILAFARERYEQDKKTYHVSADVAKVPAPDTVPDEQLSALLDQFDTRQAFHVTFGSVLTAEDGARFRDRIYEALEGREQTHYAALEAHLGRHVAPFAGRVR